MFKRVVVAGLLGMIALTAWSLLVNGVFGFNRQVNMRQLASERIVYETLKEHVVEPGRYVINPELTTSQVFPGGEPVFAIQFSGMGHESAGMIMLVQLGVSLMACMIATWMLSLARQQILSSYPWRVLFLVATGLLLALLGDMITFGIDGHSLRDALLVAANTVLSWTVAGLLVAKYFRPRPSPVKDTQ